MKLKQKKNKNYLRLKINYSIYLVWSNHKADNRHLYTALHCASAAILGAQPQENMREWHRICWHLLQSFGSKHWTDLLLHLSVGSLGKERHHFTDDLCPPWSIECSVIKPNRTPVVRLTFRGIASFSTCCRPGGFSLTHILKNARMTSTHWPH